MTAGVVGAVATTTATLIGWLSLSPMIRRIRARSARRRIVVDPRRWRRFADLPALTWRPSMRLRSRLRRRVLDRRRSLQLPELVGAIERSLRAGASLRQSIETAGRLVGSPVEEELAALASRVDAGVPLEDALHRWAQEADNDDIALVAAACELGAELGRGVATALHGVAATLAHRRDIAAEAVASGAQARASAWLLSVLPLLFVAGLAVVDRRSLTTLLWSPLGWGCLLTATLLDLGGMAWMRQQIRAAA